MLRARQHQAALHEELTGLQTDPIYELAASREGNDLVVRASVNGEVPTQLALVVGDLLHNARSALDLLVFERAQEGQGTLGRPPSADEERSLFFPITASASEFRRASAKLALFLSPAVLSRIESTQPWQSAGTESRDGPCSDANDHLGASFKQHLLRRLAALNNIDKHRIILFTIWRPHSVWEGVDAAADELGEQAREEESGQPVTDPELLRQLFEAARRADEQPEAYDFYFSDEPITDGAEVGRYIRHDGGPVPDNVEVQGSLRLVLWEPGLTDEALGGPPVAIATAAFIDEVEAVCEIVSGTS